MQYQKRSPVAVLLLSIITCGIYGLVVIYQISDEIKRFRSDPSIAPGIELLLCIITGGLYSIYWYYKFGRLVFDMQQRVGTPCPSDNTIIFVLLSVFRLNVVALMLLQTELNRVWDTVAPGV